jgi:hyperosmotically inducible protein
MAFAAPSGAPVASGDIAHQVTHEIRMYPRYTIFDNIQFRVDNGNVELVGAVSEPVKKSDLQRIVAHIPGVLTVTNDLKVLPLSPMDNRLRVQVARAIYRDPILSRYSMGALPPIHIIVDGGRVTLEGVVSTQTDKNVAGVRAGSVGLSFGPVTNNLQVENPKHVS